MGAISTSPHAERVELSGRWARLVDALSEGSFFASSAFAGLWAAQGGRPVLWVVEDEGALVAALPGVEFGRASLTRFQSMPDGCYGGVLTMPEARSQGDRWARVVLDALVERRYLKTFLVDFYGSLPDDDRFETCCEQTTLVDIDETWSPRDKKLLSQIRAAERHGIEVVPFDWARDAAKFLEMVKLTEKRHGSEPATLESSTEVSRPGRVRSPCPLALV